MFLSRTLVAAKQPAKLLWQQAIKSSQRSFSITPFTQQNVKHYNPNNFEKRLLVWTGKYKTQSEIPHHISYEEMERCRNKVRIRLANVIMGLTIVGCCIMVYSGKQAAKRGESVAQQNLDWHRRYNESKEAKSEN